MLLSNERVFGMDRSSEMDGDKGGRELFARTNIAGVPLDPL